MEESTISSLTKEVKAGRRNSEAQKILEFFKSRTALKKNGKHVMKMTCMVPGCNKELTAPSTYNMKRHFMNMHPDEFKILAPDLKKLTAEKRKLNPDALTVTIKVSIAELKLNCVKMVTVDGRPLSAVNDQSFRGLIDMILSALPKSEQFTVDTKSVQNMVFDTAANITNLIKEAIKERLINLKIDLATRLGRSYMGINIQYIENKKVSTRTLAVVELGICITTDHLLKMIENTLQSFNISIEDLYSFTFDNGSNMLRLRRLIQYTQNNMSNNENMDEDEYESENWDDAEVVEVIKMTECEEDSEDEIPEHELRMEIKKEILDQVQNSSSNVEDIQKILDKVEDPPQDIAEKYPESIANLKNQLDDTDALTSLLTDVNLKSRNVAIVGTRCVSNTLLQAVDAAVAKCNISLTLNKAHLTAVEFRKLYVKKIVRKVDNAKLIKTVLDVGIFWHSIFDMLVALLKNKRFAYALKKHALTDEEWQDVEMFVEALRPARIAAKLLQSEQMLLSEFYFIWEECKAETRKIKLDLAKAIVLAMEEKESWLFDDDSVIAAIYLDPRVNGKLTSAQERRAVDYLQNLHNRLERRRRQSEVADPNLDSVKKVVVDGAEEESTDSVSSMLAEFRQAKLRKLKDEESQRQAQSIRILLREFESEMLDFEEDLLEYWDRVKCFKPQLYEIAMIVLATPATQFSVERLFSELKFITSDQRSNSKSDYKNAALLVRSNFDLLSKTTVDGKRQKKTSFMKPLLSFF